MSKISHYSRIICFAVIASPFITVCSSSQLNDRQFPVKRQTLTVKSNLEGVWQDPTTKDIHLLKHTDSGFTVISVIEYGIDQQPIESADINSCEWENGSLTWSYRISSTGYIVSISTFALDGDNLFVQWANKDAEGKIRSGKEVLHRVAGATDPYIIKLHSSYEFSNKPPFGKIYKVNGDDLIIALHSPNNMPKAGDELIAFVGTEKVIIEVVFSMGAVAKCHIHEQRKKYFKSLKENSPVYR